MVRIERGTYMNDKLKTAIYGFAVGDALGVPYEFTMRDMTGTVKMNGGGTWSMPKGTWSDDTAFTLATCEALKYSEGISVKHIRENLEACAKGKYYLDNNVFDIGYTTREALKRGCGLTDKYNCGNGSMMRILPLAFVKNGFDYISDVSCITHAHPLCVEYCEAYVHLIHMCINGMISKSQDMEKYYPIVLLTASDSDIRSTGYVKDTMESVLWCLYNTNSYEEAVITAVRLGGDTDTIAALTGACAALIYGYNSIPKKWIRDLRGKDMIERCLF